MRQPELLDSFITKDGKKLRRGYTTGSCAAAASKAAAIMLLGGKMQESVYLMTPRGIGLTLNVQEIKRGDGFVSCGVVKHSGDDPDVTNGMMVYARVEKTDVPHEIFIDGGVGIGRVTKPGLDQPVGNAAINSTPRRMITEELRQVCEDYGYTGGLRVIISAPDGVEIAKKTFNPRLGIVGGLSILGTTGIVEPMSDEAVVETIRTELSMRAADGKNAVLFTPGNYGADYIKNELHINPEIAVTTSNFIGDAFALAAEFGFRSALLVGHIGKLIKVAGGMFNTHSRYGDCRMEIFASHAGMCGVSADVVRRIMDSAMTDDMLAILEEAGRRQTVMESVMERMDFHLTHRPVGLMQVGAVTFSNVHGILGKTASADEILEQIRKEY
ncbi:MAG: cobalamin biosynthesis protein CbiD [Clostridia bacterium]|nr:cobalamin biosynthesis protein CbiD [Clostridia bacterium]